MNANLYSLLRARFPSGDALAIETPQGRIISYTQLDAGAAALASRLRSLGVQKGDRVLAQTQKSPEALMFYLACVRSGLIYIPLNTAYKRDELAYFIGDAEPVAIVCDPASVEGVRALAGDAAVLGLDADGNGTLTEGLDLGAARGFDDVECEAGDVAAVLYTSGTTGVPKGAMLTHANLWSNALTLHAAWGFVAGDVLLHALPIFHTHGLFVACHCALLNGSRMLFMNRFDAATAITLMPRASVFMGVPTFYTRLLDEAAFDAVCCANVRLFVSGSAPLLESTFTEFERRTGHRILERYGMSETGMNTSNPLHGERRPGTVGPPLPGVEARVVDKGGAVVASGETGGLQIRGPNVFSGYWRKPERTAQEFSGDGFFHTGDLARIDADGYVSIVGRDKDLIITGGFNVYPKEVELRIDALEGVLESAVIGVAHVDFGEAVMAVIVRNTDGGALDEESVVAALKESIAGFKVPKRVVFVDELPRNAMGKVQKNVLRDAYGDLFTV